MTCISMLFEESIESDVDQRPIKMKFVIRGNRIDSITQSQSAPSGKVRQSETEDAEEVAFTSPGSDSMPKSYSTSDDSRVNSSTFEEEVKEEMVHKGWNLRSRKKPQRNAELPQADEKLEWPKFSLSLTPEEIEDDIFAMTGSRPLKKPRRRPRAVQKQLDDLFPGMRLGLITPKDYEVLEGSKKKKK